MVELCGEKFNRVIGKDRYYKFSAEEIAYLVHGNTWDEVCSTYYSKYGIDTPYSKKVLVRRVAFELLMAERCVATGEEPWLLLPKDKVDDVLSKTVMKNLLGTIETVAKTAVGYYKNFREGVYIPREYYTVIRKAVKIGVDFENNPIDIKKALFDDSNTRSFLESKYVQEKNRRVHIGARGRGFIKSTELRRQIEYKVIKDTVEQLYGIAVTTDFIKKEASISDLGTKVTTGYMRRSSLNLNNFYKIRDEAIGGRMHLIFSHMLQVAYNNIVKDSMYTRLAKEFPNAIKVTHGKARVVHKEFMDNLPVIILHANWFNLDDKASALELIAELENNSSVTEFGRALLDEMKRWG